MREGAEPRSALWTRQSRGHGWREETRAIANRAARNGAGKVGLILTAFIILLGLIGPYVAPHNLSDFVGAPYTGPSTAAPLGTDYLGHDVLTQVLYGGRTLLWMVFAASTLGVS